MMHSALTGATQVPCELCARLKSMNESQASTLVSLPKKISVIWMKSASQQSTSIGRLQRQGTAQHPLTEHDLGG